MTKVTIDRALIEKMQSLCMEVRHHSSPRMVALAIPLYEELRAALAEPAADPVAQFSASELDLLRQWFESMQDTNGGYIIDDDLALYKKIKAALKASPPPAEPAVDDLSAIEKEIAETCMETPPGWRCTRKAGHDGPCAAVPAPEDIEFVRKGMARLKESESPPPPAEVPMLSDENIQFAWNSTCADLSRAHPTFHLAFARQVEAAVRRKAGL